MRVLRILIGSWWVFCQPALPAARSVDFRAHYNKREVRIPMRDGVHLFTAIYTPKDSHQTHPFLMTRTPYSVGSYGSGQYPKLDGNPLAGSGFILVFQDVRGRNMSEGTFVEERPIKDHLTGPRDTDETTDTYDTIEWLLHNVPNHNGKVGLFGISYGGFYTSAGLVRPHPALVAASPQAPMGDLFQGDDAYHNGALFLLSNFSFYTGFGPQQNPSLPEPSKPYPYGTEDGYAFYLKHRTLRDLNGNPYWTDVRNHATYDEYWQSRDILKHLSLAPSGPAVLIVGGWFDAEDLSGTLKTFHALQQSGTESKLNLVMGPWTHGSWAGGLGDKLGQLTFGSATAQFFREKIELPFFLHYLENGPDPALPAASLFETGQNVWRQEASWPPQRAQLKTLYLRENHQLSFDKPTDESAYDEYTSDPASPVPFLAKPILETPPDYMVADQRFAQNRPDVVTYCGEPLSHDLEVAGPVRPLLTVSTGGTDSDFDVKLIDVHPDGYQQLIRGEPFRAKFRKSFEAPEAMMPQEPTAIRFSMPDVYHSFRQGHRLMVQIQSSWFPLVDRNPQTFVNIPDAKESDFVKATERIYRCKSAASGIELPVLP